MYRCPYAADVEKHPTGIGRGPGPRLFPPTQREIAHLPAMLSHLPLCCILCLLHDMGCLRLSVARVGSPPRHRYATIASDRVRRDVRSLSRCCIVPRLTNNSSVDAPGCILARLIVTIYEAIAEIVTISRKSPSHLWLSQQRIGSMLVRSRS